MPFVNTPKFPGAIAGVADLLNQHDTYPSSPAPMLSAYLSSVATSLTLTAGTGSIFPSNNFSIAIGDEIIFVATRSADTLSGLVRGSQGTTANSHSTGTRVTATITAWHHNQLASEVNAIETQLGTNLDEVKINVTPSQISGGFTIGADARNSFYSFNGTAPATWKLPNPAAGITFDILVENTTPYPLTIDPNGLNLDGSTTPVTLGQNEGLRIAAGGSGYWSFRGKASGGGSGFTPAWQTLTFATTIAWPANSGSAKVILTGATAKIQNPTAAQPGMIYSLLVTQDATGGRTLTWDTNFRFPSGSAPNLASAANANTLISFMTDGTLFSLISTQTNLIAPTLFPTATLKCHVSGDTITGKSDGDPLTDWQDQSGNSNDYTATGTPPTYHTNQINSLPAVTFTSSGTYLNAASGISALTDLTILVVVQCDNSAGDQFAIEEYTEGFGLQKYGSNWNLYDGTNHIGAVSNTTSPYFIFALRRNSAGTEFWSNAALIASGTNYFTLSGLDLGGSGHYLQPLTGSIAELMVYNSKLSDADLAQAFSYLNAKYAIY